VKVEQKKIMNDKLKAFQKMMGTAGFLYERGWRARDRNLLKECFDFSDDEADLIVAWLILLE